MKTLYKHKNKILLLIIILLSLPFIFNTGLDLDEPFTMGLVRHNYVDIINLTKLDIHPPLYYLTLKLFLQITTFWTQNVFIQIIFARILSCIFGVVSCFYIFKILLIINIKINKYLGMLLFISLPLGLGPYNQFTNIRMYELSIMLMCIEVYYVLKLHNKFNLIYDVPIFLSIVCNLYTNYFSGLIAGLYLIIFFILYFFEKDWKRLVNCLLVGISSIMLFLPWIPQVFNQSSTQGIVINHINIGIIVMIIPIIMTNFIAYKFYKNYSLLHLLVNILLIILFLILLTSSILSRFTIRYLSSLLYPLTCILIAMIFNIHTNYYSKIKNTTLLFFSVILVLSYSYSCYKVISTFDLPSISFIQKLKTINKSNNRNVNAKDSGIETYRWNSNGQNHGGGGGNSIYLLSIHKNISDKNYISTYQVIGNGNKKLFKAVFPNIKHYSTKKPN